MIGRLKYDPSVTADPTVAPSFHEALRFWIKLGFISFGGPSGQIAIMHRELVEKRRWISGERFLHALNFCMLLPGPEAMQLATYIGWLLHKTRGGIAAGALFVLPSAILLWLLSWLYMAFGNVPSIAALFEGLKPAVLAIILSALLRMGQKALRNIVLGALSFAAFVALFFLNAPFPMVIALAALIGACWPRAFSAPPESPILAPPRPSAARALRVMSVSLLLWWAPVGAAALWLGADHAIIRQALFFSKAALVTFGGAYAVLPYVSQQAVEHYQWLSPAQMLDGLGLAETTPGPLIMVLQFVGFVGAWQHPGALSPLAAATLGAFLTTWTTFIPCFLWIFLGAPHIEQLRGRRKLGAALAAVTAAVTGVILNLAVWFGLHLLFPRGQPPNLFAAALAALAFFALQKWKLEVVWIIAGGALAGLLKSLLAP